MTLEPRRILMRRLSPLLALLFVTPALAETLDCAVIKSTTRPFDAGSLDESAPTAPPAGAGVLSVTFTDPD